MASTPHVLFSWRFFPAKAENRLLFGLLFRQESCCSNDLRQKGGNRNRQKGGNRNRQTNREEIRPEQEDNRREKSDNREKIPGRARGASYAQGMQDPHACRLAFSGRHEDRREVNNPTRLNHANRGMLGP